MKKIKYLPLLAIPFLLIGCNSTPTNKEGFNFKDHLKSLIAGHKVSGVINEYRTFFTNDQFEVATGEQEIRTYEFEYVYTSENSLIGVDRILKRTDLDRDINILVDNSIYNNGYVDLNWIDYDNTAVLNDPAIIDYETMEKVPYASNGLNNPFNLFNASDFTLVKGSENTYDVSKLKTRTMITEMFSMIGDNKTQGTIASSVATIKDNVLEKIDVLTNPLNLQEPKPGNTKELVYFQSSLDIDLNYSEHGDTYSVELIQPFEDKGYTELQNALNNMAEAQNFTIERHADYTEMGAKEQETIITYFAGDTEKGGIFEKIYDYSERETALNNPTNNDTYFRKNSAYGVYQSGAYVANDGKTYGYGVPALNGYTYRDYLPNFRGVGRENSDVMSANVFNYNAEEDAYYLDTRLTGYAIGEAFLPFFMVSDRNFLGDGYQVKVKLTEDKQYIQEITARAAHYFVSYVDESLYNIYFSDYGTTKIPEYVVR